MKKHGFILAIALSICSFSFSQEIDVRLTKKYSQTELNQMIHENPSQYKMLVYALDNACYVIEVPEGKEIASFGTVDVDTSKPYTFIDLGLEITSQNQYLKINGTKKMLVVKSEWVLNHELTSKK